MGVSLDVQMFHLTCNPQYSSVEMDDSDWDSGPEEALGQENVPNEQVPSTNFVNNNHGSTEAAATARHVTAANMKIPGRSLPVPTGTYDPSANGKDVTMPPRSNQIIRKKLKPDSDSNNYQINPLKIKVRADIVNVWGVRELRLSPLSRKRKSFKCRTSN